MTGIPNDPSPSPSSSSFVREEKGGEGTSRGGEKKDK